MPGIFTDNDIKEIVSYHAPDEKGLERIQHIRDAAEQFIVAICRNTPVCADQSAAVRHAREAMMTANAAIALRGKI